MADDFVMDDGYITRYDTFAVLTEYYHHTHELQGKALQEALSRVPDADVRPVVLCKDCKYNRGLCTDIWGNPAVVCTTGVEHRPDWHCADGKRENDAD